jgi:hypothetical protein
VFFFYDSAPGELLCEDDGDFAAGVKGNCGLEHGDCRAMPVLVNDS